MYAGLHDCDVILICFFYDCCLVLMCVVGSSLDLHLEHLLMVLATYLDLRYDLHSKVYWNDEIGES